MVAVGRMGVRRRHGKGLLGKFPEILLKCSGQFGEVDRNSHLVDWVIHPP